MKKQIQRLWDICRQATIKRVIKQVIFVLMMTVNFQQLKKALGNPDFKDNHLKSKNI